MAPHFGAVITPVDGFDISLTAHSPQKMEIVTGFSTFLPNGDLQRADRTATLDWLRGRSAWALNGTFCAWRSTAWVSSRARVIGSGLTMWIVRAIGLSKVTLGRTPWRSLWLRHVYKDKLSSFIDANYEASPVPDQTGRTNYVDNDRLGFGAGVNYECPSGIPGSLRVSGCKVKCTCCASVLNGSSIQRARGSRAATTRSWCKTNGPTAHQQPRRSAPRIERLQTNNPGWPGFSSKGIIWGGGINLAVMY